MKTAASMKQCGITRILQWRRNGIVWLCLSLLALPAHAIWLGQSQVNPYVELQAIYDSNLYNANADEESAVITVISPGVHARFPHAEGAPVRLIGNYRANIKFYNQHGDNDLDPDEELNTVEHRLEAKMESRLASGLRFGAGYVLNLTSFPPGGPREIRNRYTQHDVTLMGGYAFVNRYELQLEYTGLMRGYKESAFDDNDTTTHNLDATFFYRLFPTLTLLGGGGYGKSSPKGEFLSDSTLYRGYGGARFDATETLTGQVKIGVTSKNFEKSGFKDVTTVYASGELTAMFTETTKLLLTLNREVSDTSLAGPNAGTGEYYIRTGLQANLAHTLAVLPNLSLKASAGFSKDDYPEDIEERDDTIFEIGIGAQYKFLKYLSLGADYRYANRDSSVGADYSSNRATLSLQGIL
jgi:opacity protein-like surface antigen